MLKNQEQYFTTCNFFNINLAKSYYFDVRNMLKFYVPSLMGHPVYMSCEHDIETRNMKFRSALIEELSPGRVP